LRNEFHGILGQYVTYWWSAMKSNFSFTMTKNKKFYHGKIEFKN
jgi:hypothetical protein